MQIMDMWTNNIASRGTRTTGSAAGDVLLAGPGWSGAAPPGVSRTVRCPTRYAWVLVQMAASGPEDFAEIHALQDQLKLTPVSAWGTPYEPPEEVAVDPGRDTEEVAVDPGRDTTATPFDQVRLMDGPTFFGHLARALEDNPPYPSDRKAVRRLRQIGIVPGKDFDVRGIDPAVAKGLTRAAHKIWTTLQSAPYSMTAVNGWLLPVNLGRYGDDYKTRAFISFVGLGALCWEDAVYPSAFVDGDGAPLDGARNYVLHLNEDQIFPSQSGVWSISAYRENFYVRNPIERYGITSGMPLAYNDDGSLDVYIQAESPGGAQETNWLPCPPSGPFNLSVRIYQPFQKVIVGRTENNLLVEPAEYEIPPVVAVTSASPRGAGATAAGLVPAARVHSESGANVKHAGGSARGSR